MRDHFTKRNHYNPCSWTAFWNKEYFAAVLAGNASSLPLRKQTVFVLNVMADHIYQTTVENVHYDRGLGVAEITPDSAKDFCRRRFPDRYDSFAKYVDQHPENLYIDFEDILEGIENQCGYESLLAAARSGELASPVHRGFLICALVIHAMRSHEMMNSMIDSVASFGMSKWEYFWILKNAWSNAKILARPAIALASGRWTLYRTPEHRFPLCDSPVMIGRDTLMAILSPRLILEVDLTKSSPKDTWTIVDGIEPSKYEEFLRRAIGNSFKQIIFDDAEELKKWRLLPECQERMAVLRDPTSRQKVEAEAASRVIWALQGFGRVPDDFEDWFTTQTISG